MLLVNDRQIKISAAGNRKATQWPAQSLYWSEMISKLSTPVRSTETLAQYLQLPKSKQDDLKDVGGFVGGTLTNNRRKSGNVQGRDIVTLDLDNIQPGQTLDVLRRVDGLGCGYAVYSTRKHEEAKPRLRIIIPTDRTCSVDEYEPLARKLASLIGIELCDASTFEASRLMYWPSCCVDSTYVFTYGDKPFLSVDGVLSMYTNWRNVAEWPQVPGAQQTHARLVQKQGDPVSKAGVVGAFCKTYDIYRAIDTFLMGEYAPCDDNSGRYTYTGGSTVGGAVVYDNGNFLFSHHATDPAGGKLCNAFDLVRLHRFHQLDDEAKPDTPSNKLPSFTAMCELAVADASVAAIINQERYEKATHEFNAPIDEGVNWMQKLQTSSTTGQPSKTTNNILIILENDPLLKGKMAYDEFACKAQVLGKLPWDSREERRIWNDNDDAGIRWYLEKTYGISGKDKVNDALSICGRNNAFDDVKSYLTSLQWDGMKRLDTLFIDYLGAADASYTRAITRKAFTAAVARIMVPGTKFDNMTILTGPQGHGKTTLLRKMGRVKWFSDSIKTFEGKEASELVQGVWIVEIGELEALNKSEVGRIKQFLSQCEDIFRAAYGRNVGWYPRRCVFFGTSNNYEYLRDKTGNRRFWPLDIGVTQKTKDVHTQLDSEVDQIWAEAFMRWQLGEPLFLSGETEAAAREEQDSHRERSAREGLIREFIERDVPEDWKDWNLERRRMYWAGAVADSLNKVKRNKICALEVWCELFQGDFKGMKYQDAFEINGIIGMMDGWKKQKNGSRYGYCGLQRGFEKVLHSNDTSPNLLQP